MRKWGSRSACLLSTYASRGDVEPLAGFAVRLRALGAEVRVCAPPDEEFAERLDDVSVPLVPAGQPVRAMVTGATPSAAGLPRRAAELVAAQFDAVAAGCAVGEVNQQALFGRVAAVVHHGGAGTTTTAARACAPQVVVPQVVDQPYWAGRVAGLGIGTAHDCPIPTTESLSAGLRTALTPETRASDRRGRCDPH